MTGQAKIKQIADYVKQTCERFQVWDDDPVAAKVELPNLHRAIERLMRISAKTKDSIIEARQMIQSLR